MIKCHFAKCREVKRKILVKCSLESHLSSRFLSKHVLSGLAASLIFISPINQVCIEIQSVTKSGQVWHDLLLTYFFFLKKQILCIFEPQR